jgi:hypothetical protein
MEQVDARGVLVQGRTERELVPNPALTPMNQARDALPKPARAVLLTNPKPAGMGRAFERGDG